MGRFDHRTEVPRKSKHLSGPGGASFRNSNDGCSEIRGRQHIRNSESAVKIRDIRLRNDRGRSEVSDPAPGLVSGFALCFIPLKRQRNRQAGMRSKLKIIKGTSFNLIIEEVNETDSAGRLLLYVASVYLHVRGSSRMHLVRRSRVPDAAAGLERDARLGRIDVAHLIDVMNLDLPAV